MMILHIDMRIGDAMFTLFENAPVWEEGRCIDLLDSDLLFSLMVSSWLCNKHLVVLKVSLCTFR